MIRITPALPLKSWHVVVLALKSRGAPVAQPTCQCGRSDAWRNAVPWAADRVRTAPLNLHCCCGRCQQTSANS